MKRTQKRFSIKKKKKRYSIKRIISCESEDERKRKLFCRKDRKQNEMKKKKRKKNK